MKIVTFTKQQTKKSLGCKNKELLKKDLIL